MVKVPSSVWARRNFLGSMQYLAGLFLAVLADVHISLN
jgi:heme O synthase-like polyprenyltransferase